MRTTKEQRAAVFKKHHLYTLTPEYMIKLLCVPYDATAAQRKELIYCMVDADCDEMIVGLREVARRWARYKKQREKEKGGSK